MKKRTFIKTTSILAAGSIIGCNQSGAAAKSNSSASGSSTFELPELSYGYDALAPNIDARTMEIHHSKHHAGYVRKFNAALESSPLAGKTLEEILASVGASDTALRNNGGGHYNHSLYWSIMKPGGSTSPKGDLADAINSSFGSFDKCKELFKDAALKRFGSGWAWLCQGSDGKLAISSTPNQDNPKMVRISESQGEPLLGIDVWEHAYYLNYQNRRGDYVDNFFNVINWDAVQERLS